MPTGGSSVVTVPSDGPSYHVTVPEGATEVQLALGAPSSPGAAVVIPVEVTVETSVGASLLIPPDTSVTSTDPGWDGTIQLPKVVNDVVVPTTAGQSVEIGLAIELGSPTARIEFDAAVKLVLAGQAGKSVAYIQAGSFHRITAECPATAPIGITTDECWMNDGDDLGIWTNHFTTFLAYGVSAAALPATGAPDMFLLVFVALGALGVGVVVMGLRVARTRRS